MTVGTSIFKRVCTRTCGDRRVISDIGAHLLDDIACTRMRSRAHRDRIYERVFFPGIAYSKAIDNRERITIVKNARRYCTRTLLNPVVSRIKCKYMWRFINENMRSIKKWSQLYFSEIKVHNSCYCIRIYGNFEIFKKFLIFSFYDAERP